MGEGQPFAPALPFFAPLNIESFASAKLTTNISQHFTPASPFSRPQNRELCLFPTWSLAFFAPLNIGALPYQSSLYIVSLEKPEYYGSFAFISYSEVKSSTHNRKVLRKGVQKLVFFKHYFSELPYASSKKK